jgi:hypothetical protein
VGNEKKLNYILLIPTFAVLCFMGDRKGQSKDMEGDV